MKRVSTTITTIPWGELSSQDLPLNLHFSDNKKITISRDENEIQITSEWEKKRTIKRFVTGVENNIYLEPGLPELPIVIKPEHSVCILPLKKFSIYIEVPLVIKLLYGTAQHKKLLIEFQNHQLSRSYLENSESSEFAYFLESPLFCHIDDYSKQDTSIYCPVFIFNKSSENLEFEKMILRAPYLSIFLKEKKLIASPVLISFRGPEQISQISYKKNLPEDEEGVKLMSLPRMKQDKSLLKRSFSLIKNLYTG